MRYLVAGLILLFSTAAQAFDVCPRTVGSIIISGDTLCPSPTTGGGGGGGSGTVGNVGTFTSNRFILGAGGLNVTESAAMTGLVMANGASAPTAYTGGVCTNQFVRSVSGSGALACEQVSLTTDVTGTLAGTQTPAYTGDVTKPAGSLTTTIANNAVTDAKIVGMAASKLTGTLPAAQFPALTGPITTTAGSLATSITAGSVTNAMLAGSIDLATKVTGVLATQNGGTGMASAADDTLLMSNGSFWQARPIPDCPDTAGKHLNYLVASNDWVCGTSTSGLTPVTAAGTLPADELIAGNGGTQVKVATMPVLFRAEDSSIQFSVTATQNAANYIETQSALSGIGPTVAATSVIDTDVDLGLVGQGSGCINLGNGDLAAPILRACSPEVAIQTKASVGLASGDAINLTSTTVGQRLALRLGSSTALDASPNPALKIERSMAIGAPGAGDGAEELAGAVINVINYGNGTSTAQPVGLYAGSLNLGPKDGGVFTSGDAVGLYGAGIAQNGVGIGAVFFARGIGATSEANGVEITVDNATGVDKNWDDVDGRPTFAGIWMTASTKRASAGMAFISTTQFDVGIGVSNANAIRTATLRDAGNATTSLSIAGTHTYALDVASGAGAIRTAGSIKLGTTGDVAISRTAPSQFALSTDGTANSLTYVRLTALKTAFTPIAIDQVQAFNSSDSPVVFGAFNWIGSSHTAGAESAYATFQLRNAGSGPNTTITYTPGGTVFGAEAFPAASAVVDIQSTTQGFLPPRMTTTQRDAISSPAEGLVIYNTTTHRLNVRDNTAWRVVTFD